MSENSLTQEAVIDLVTGLLELAQESGCNEEVAAAHRLREKVLKNEWYLMLIGETSSGKSTFANTVLDENLIPVSASPTTGAVVFVHSAVECLEAKFFGIKTDGTIGDSLTREEFQKAAAGEGQINRLLIRKATDHEFPAGLVMVDTPGFNSVINEHLSTLHQCLPEADAIFFFINYRKGVSKTDGKYLTQLTGMLGGTGDDRLAILVNFSTTAHEDKRISEIRSTLNSRVGYKGKIYPLMPERVNGRLRLLNARLVSDLQLLAKDKDRQLTLWRNALVISRGLLERIGESLDLKQRIICAEDAAIDNVRKRLAELEANNASMDKIIHGTQAEMTLKVKEIVQAGKIHIEQRVDVVLEEQSAWKDIESAKIYISGTVLDCGVQDLGSELNEYMRRRIGTFCEELDGLAATGQETIQKLMELDLPERSTAIGQKLAGRLAGQAAGRGAGVYLGGLAGAPGEAGVVGVMNLTRKAMGYVNKLFKPILGENIFGREAMAKVGPLLRQFGATTARVASFAAAAALEAVVYLYKVATWKGKLQKGLLPLVQDHCAYLEKESLAIIEDTIAATQEMVEANFVRRSQVISDALAARETQRAMSPEQFERLAIKWNENFEKVNRALSCL